MAAELFRGGDYQRVVVLDAVFLLDFQRVADKVNGNVRFEELSEVVQEAINLLACPQSLGEHRIAKLLQHLC
jgi:hypothetical protein